MMIVQHLPRGNAFWSGSFAMGCGCQFPGTWIHLQLALCIGQGLGQGDYDGVFVSIQPYQVGNLQPEAGAGGPSVG